MGGTMRVAAPWSNDGWLRWRALGEVGALVLLLAALLWLSARRPVLGTADRGTLAAATAAPAVSTAPARRLGA